MDTIAPTWLWLFFVAAVLAAAQRLGVTKLGIIGSEQFIE
jgi:hypothetical protein